MKVRVWSEVMQFWELNVWAGETELEIPEELVTAHEEAYKRFVELDSQINAIYMQTYPGMA